MPILPHVLAIKLLIIAFIALIAPILAAQFKHFRMPSVVYEIILGVIIGPQVLNLVQPVFQITALAKIGLVLLIFLAGYEIDPVEIKGKPLILASYSWLGSLVIASILAVILLYLGISIHYFIVPLALTTTAFGTLLPILQDANIFKQRLGPYILATGTLGEFGPIVIISMLFSASKPIAFIFLTIFLIIGILSAFLIIKLHSSSALNFVKSRLHMSDQLPVRLSMLIILILVCFTMKLDLDVLLGAFSAGILLTFLNL